MTSVLRAPRTGRRLSVIALALAVTTGGIVATATPAAADRDRNAEAWFVSAINAERSDRGIAPLQAAGDLSEVAAAWSGRMASDGQLRHNPSYTSQICCWEVVTENVAYVGGIGAAGGLDAALRQAHRGLMGSSGHKANILRADVDQVGVGVHVADDRLWVTQNFRRHVGTSATAAPAAPEPQEPVPTADPPDAQRDDVANEPANETDGGASDRATGDRTGGDDRGGRTVGPEEVADVQTRLAALGWYAGEVDGRAGPQTREALSGFQAAAGIEVNGTISVAALRALEADDPPHRWGAGSWDDVTAAFDALREQARQTWIASPLGTSDDADEHPVMVAIGHLADARG